MLMVFKGNLFVCKSAASFFVSSGDENKDLNERAIVEGKRDVVVMLMFLKVVKKFKVVLNLFVR